MSHNPSACTYWLTCNYTMLCSIQWTKSCNMKDLMSKAFVVAWAFLLTVVLSGACKFLKGCLCLQASNCTSTQRGHTLCWNAKHWGPGTCCRATFAFQLTIGIHNPDQKYWAAFWNEHYKNAFWARLRCGQHVWRRSFTSQRSCLPQLQSFRGAGESPCTVIYCI